MIENTIKRLAKVEKEPGDYTGPDGLLYCGKCRMPKQWRMDHNPLTCEPVETLVPIACQCRLWDEEETQKKQEAELFRMRMDHLWEDGISCLDGLSYHFAEDDGQNPKISAPCRRYVERWDEMKKDDIGILFFGSVGTGKSFLASCIGNALLEKQVTVAYTNFPRLLNLLQGTRDRQELLDRLKKYQLLIIDDLGVERDSAYATEQVFNVIDARDRSKLPLIVTTNLTLEELEHPVSMQYARIYDRILNLCPVRLKMTGASRRIENAERRKEAARKLLLES